LGRNLKDTRRLPVTRDNVRETVRAFVTQELMNKPGYALRDDERMLTDGLIDSMSVVRIAHFVEESFGVVIPDEDLVIDKIDTLEQLVDRICADLPHAV
jgi:acyl carrier protein